MSADLFPRRAFVRCCGVALLSLPAFAAPVRAADDPGWQTIQKPLFSFSIPAGFKRQDAQGFEGIIEQYVGGDGVRLWFEAGALGEKREFPPKETVFEAVKVGDATGRISTIDKTGAKVNGTSSTGIELRHASGTVVRMHAFAQTAQDLATAKKIFLTIRFPGAKTEAGQ